MHAPLDEMVVPADGELIDGRVKERITGTRAAVVGGNIFVALKAHCERRNLGWVFLSRVPYRCFPNSKTVRKPDVSYVRFGRLPDETLPRGEMRIPPDLAVEVVSPNDTVYELDSKLADYRLAGIPLVWVINPDSRVALVYRGDKTVSLLHESDWLDGEGVVPGFRCQLSSVLLVGGGTG